MHLIWAAITLLNTLRNPRALTKLEIAKFRGKIIENQEELNISPR